MRNAAICLLAFSALGALSFAGDLPDASWNRLPRWRGFNLLEKFNTEKGKPFLEEDFKLIAELGFNFVRLPMDYRVWIRNGDWRSFDEGQIDEIGQAVEWGRKYGVHVCLNFHRAPGYTVAKPPEAKPVWRDPEALEVCSLHWAHFAKRFKGVPNRNLSFNLMNEPAGVSESDYKRVVSALADAIRKEDPARLIIADGLGWGTKPCPSLVSLKVAQATRGYAPTELTHYKASWMGQGHMMLPPPVWPANLQSSFLYGSAKPDLKSPLVIKFSKPLARPLELSIEVGTVSSSSLLAVSADGKRVFEKLFKCGPGEGEWSKAVYVKEWGLWQNVYGKSFKCGIIPAGASRLEIENADGDWMTFSRLSLAWGDSSGKDRVASFIPGLSSYGKRQEGEIEFNQEAGGSFRFPLQLDAAWLKANCLGPWKALEAQGSGVVVGEFGCYNKTSHDVALAWMEDCLRNWKDAGWGWALWNFRGSFGVMDSERADVQYEDFRSHKLDRAMLELLRKY